ncbi:BTB/POZ domain-containing protein At1g01640-like [Papaver somniferum]|uniref:BTB/POZ domain-containing protein At1g01640-like n=1 Tax=Papaver somniferum TaxID=3469 RepID=UPI000E6F9963|nr:BTB/POZ domain-containing protein At1g01640-like [Papaver somniferum]
MPCSFCKKNTVHFYNAVYDGHCYHPGSLQHEGVAVCNRCYEEVLKIVNFINNDLQEKSISYPADTNWGGRLVEEMEDREGFHSDLADAFRKGIPSDIQVKPSSGPSIGSHRILLATRSEILKNMLKSDSGKAAPEDFINLPEFNHEELDTFLEFLYRGDLPTESFRNIVAPY